MTRPAPGHKLVRLLGKVLMPPFCIGDLVLIRQKGKPYEFYDLAADPAQKSDLAARRPDAVRELDGHLQKVRARDNDARVK